MVFLTDVFLDDIAELAEPVLYEPELIAFSKQTHFTAEAAVLLQEYSFRTRLAYIEMEFVDGIRAEAGILYENGHVLGIHREGEGIINLLLRELGVWCLPGRDEFDSLHLDRYRRMDKWVK